MSRFSGKCDLYDHFDGVPDDIIAEYDIYPHNSAVPLKIMDRTDLVPYYPYLVVIGTWGDGKGTLCLSDKSFVDTEERRLLEAKKASLLKIFHKCKRKKSTFDPHEAAKQISVYDSPHSEEVEIALRIAEAGGKANLDGIHDAIHEHYRQELLEEMVKAGYSKAFSRWWIWKDIKLLLEEPEEC